MPITMRKMRRGSDFLNTTSVLQSNKCGSSIYMNAERGGGGGVGVDLPQAMVKSVMSDVADTLALYI